MSFIGHKNRLSCFILDFLFIFLLSRRVPLVFSYRSSQLSHDMYQRSPGVIVSDGS